MSQITVQRITGVAGERIALRSELLAFSLEPDARLVLEDARDPRTWMTGGPLFELAATTNAAKPHTYIMGSQTGGAPVGDADPFEDVHGSGYHLREDFALPAQSIRVTLDAYLYADRPCLRIALRLRHIGTAPVRLERIFPFVSGSWWSSDALRLSGKQNGFAAYVNGWQSWSFAGGLPPGRPLPRPRMPTQVVWHLPGGRAMRAPIAGAADVISDEVALLGLPQNKQALLVGFLSAQKWLGQIFLHRPSGALAAGLLMDGYLFNPGDELALPALVLAIGPQRALLTEYADMVGREHQARRANVPPTGWSSWYYYYGTVAASDISENVSAMVASHSLLPLEVAQIDDGYESAVGDWLQPNARFPDGMAVLAREIRDAGYRPGLWLAPFTVAASSELAREHPDWLIQNARGRPAWGGRNWGQNLYGLDTTHPGTRNWLRALLTTITREWGYDYLKLDFLASAALSGMRNDPTIPRGQALREGLALIREVVGEEVFLLGCGCPLLSAVGLVDAMRIGPDVAPYWAPIYHNMPLTFADGQVAPALRGALRSTLTRAWMHPALWLNDPDCLLVRDRETTLTLDQVRAYASAVALTGGMVTLSDRLRELPISRVALAATLLPPMRERAQPVDYFAWDVPSVVLAEITRPWGQWALAGLFNESSQPRELTVRWNALGLAPDHYHAVEFWSGLYLGCSDEGARVRVGPHGAAVLAIHPRRDEPQLLSTSFHVTQGAAELVDWNFNSARGEASWRLRLGRHATGTVTLWAPPEWQPRELESTAVRSRWRRDARGLIRITTTVEGEAIWQLKLEHAL